MRSSSAIRRASARASSAHSASVTPAIGISGSTSVAPHAGMRPLVAAHVDQFGRPLHPGKSGLDDRFGFADEGHDRAVVASPGSTSSSLTPPEASMAAVICRITALSRPSLKLGTHSMILWDIGSSHLNSYTSKINNNREKSEKTVTKQAAFCEKQKARCICAPGQDCSRTEIRGGSAPVSEKRGYLPMVSVTPPVHQKPGRRIPPMSQ